MKLSSFIIFIFILFGCASQQSFDFSDKERKQIDSIVYSNRNIDSLKIIVDRFNADKNKLGEIVAYRELGRCYRNASQFSEALDAHKKGLALAQEICDTIQIIQALNNIGTAYRRMGVLDEAASWHYQALTYCGKYSDTTSTTAIKNRVVSLNGIGNVQLTLDNTEMAESAFRRALKGESSLGSALGQAINYANLGAILEKRGQVDSARHYYSESLKYNELADSDLGISLCHTHFGRLYENEGDYSKAIEEYKKAYDVMVGKKDKWHWLDACMSLSRVYSIQGNSSLAEKYLATAKVEAHKMNSLGHLADVYKLEYTIKSRKGNHKEALNAYVKSEEYSDSLANEKNLTHMQNVRVRYEREMKKAEMGLLQQGFEEDKRRRNMILISIVFTLLVSIVAIIFLIYALYLRSKNHKIMEELESTRTNFFTNITHEFRTPLTVIQSAAYDIHTRVKTDKVLQRDSVDILRHSNGLLNLVNQVLEIAKMTSGAPASTPQWKRGDVVGFISMICEGYVRYAQERKIDLQYVFNEEKFEMEFIPDYLIRIVQNLVSNAIKFSNEGSQVLVSVEHVVDHAQDNLRIYVCDSGIGMSHKQKQDIFKPFYQASTDSKNIGTGIGLSLVKLAVQAMNGTVDVHSYPSEGSVFIVDIPVRQVDPSTETLQTEDYELKSVVNYDTPSPAMEDEVSSDLDSPRILIVEDTPEVARWQMRQLNPRYNFYFAGDGDEGLKKAEEIVPDLIITDIMMPVMDGLQMCRKIRESELLCHIPVIMVTAKASQEDKIAGLKAGADAYLEKPFNADELSVRVEKLLQQREMLRKKFLDMLTDESSESEVDLSIVDKAFVDKFSTEIHDLITKGKIDYNELASKFYLSRTQLNRKVKAVTGYTTTEYILQIRISMAKQLLMKTDYPIGDIAIRCGIEDVAYFSLLFRKNVGKTPSEYRNR